MVRQERKPVGLWVIMDLNLDSPDRVPEPCELMWVPFHGLS